MANKYEDEERRLASKFGRDTRMSVPEGYFDSFADNMMKILPANESITRHVEMTRWQKLKPYVCLAAMFGGIWLMMNVVGRFIRTDTVNLDNPPENIAMMMEKMDVNDNYYLPDDVFSDMEIESEVASSYDSMEDFERDFESIDEIENAEAPYSDEGVE